MQRPLAILCILRDPLPPRRPDVLTLFGAELPRHGIRTALVGQAAGTTGTAWAGGALHLAGRFGGAVNSLLAPLWDSLAMLRAWRAVRSDVQPDVLFNTRPDIIQVRDKILVAIVARLAAALLRVPFVYWMSFPIVEGYALHARAGAVRFPHLHVLRAWLTHWLLYRQVLPQASLIFVQSDAMADALAGRGIARSRLATVPMGIDLALAAAVTPSRHPRLAGRSVVVYLGSVARARDSAFLLDLAAALAVARPDVLLVIAGDAPSGRDAAWFRAELARCALDQHVLFTGWLPHVEALGFVARAAVGISPVPRGALFDVSSPTKLVEYLAMGVPAVASDIPDQRHVIDSSGAGHCVSMTVPDFCTAILRLLDDPERALRGRQGQAWVNAHRSYAVLGQAVAARYRSLLAEGA